MPSTKAWKIRNGIAEDQRRAHAARKWSRANDNEIVHEELSLRTRAECSVKQNSNLSRRLDRDSKHCC